MSRLNEIELREEVLAMLVSTKSNYEKRLEKYKVDLSKAILKGEDVDLKHYNTYSYRILFLTGFINSIEDINNKITIEDSLIKLIYHHSTTSKILGMDVLEAIEWYDAKEDALNELKSMVGFVERNNSK